MNHDSVMVHLVFRQKYQTEAPFVVKANIARSHTMLPGSSIHQHNLLLYQSLQFTSLSLKYSKMIISEEPDSTSIHRHTHMQACSYVDNPSCPLPLICFPLHYLKKFGTSYPIILWSSPAMLTLSALLKHDLNPTKVQNPTKLKFAGNSYKHFKNFHCQCSTNIFSL